MRERLGAVTSLAFSPKDYFCTVEYGFPCAAVIRHGGFYPQADFDKDNDRAAEKLSTDKVTRNMYEYFRKDYDILYFNDRGWAMLINAHGAKGGVNPSVPWWNLNIIALNSCICLISILAVTVLFEYLIRRGEARKP